MVWPGIRPEQSWPTVIKLRRTSALLNVGRAAGSVAVRHFRRRCQSQQAWVGSSSSSTYHGKLPASRETQARNARPRAEVAASGVRYTERRVRLSAHHDPSHDGCRAGLAQAPAARVPAPAKGILMWGPALVVTAGVAPCSDCENGCHGSGSVLIMIRVMMAAGPAWPGRRRPEFQPVSAGQWNFNVKADSRSHRGTLQWRWRRLPRLSASIGPGVTGRDSAQCGHARAWALLRLAQIWHL